jgi:Ca2+-binding EF-hand superfamily protein
LRHSIAEDEARKAFQKFDQNGDNTVTIDELTRLMPVATPDAIRAMFAEVDENKDGVLTFEEVRPLRRCAPCCAHGPRAQWFKAMRNFQKKK